MEISKIKPQNATFMKICIHQKELQKMQVCMFYIFEMIKKNSVGVEFRGIDCTKAGKPKIIFLKK